MGLDRMKKEDVREPTPLLILIHIYGVDDL